MADPTIKTIKEDVWVKSSEVNTDVAVKTLSIVFWGE